MAGIAANLKRIKEQVVEAAEHSGRDPLDIKLVAVTKNVSVSRLYEAMACGLNIFGENRVQDWEKKYDIIKDQAEWHFIGHLQSNKVKKLAGKICLLHSLDSLDLADVLERVGKNADITWKTLAQVNVAGEVSKYGLDPNDLVSFLEMLNNYRYVEVSGLMTIAPLSSNPEKTRTVFRKLRELKEEMIIKNGFTNLKDLSMGMSSDFTVAVEEGATIVRIGSALFREI